MSKATDKSAKTPPHNNKTAKKNNRPPTGKQTTHSQTKARRKHQYRSNGTQLYWRQPQKQPTTPKTRGLFGSSPHTEDGAVAKEDHIQQCKAKAEEVKEEHRAVKRD
jgi:hypothetical protein